MIIAIDFDGTIHNLIDREPGKKMGKPFPGARDTILELVKRGHVIVIHTYQGDQPHIRAWLSYFDIHYDKITNIKPDAGIFIDDRALRFTGDWAKTGYNLGVLGA